MDIFYGPYNEIDEDDAVLYLTDVTGTIGEWLDADYSDIPQDVMGYLYQAYALSVRHLQKEM